MNPRSATLGADPEHRSRWRVECNPACVILVGGVKYRAATG